MRNLPTCVIATLLLSSAQCFDLSRNCRDMSNYFKSALIATALIAIPMELTATIAIADETVPSVTIAVPSVVTAEQPKVVLKEYRRSTSTGIEYYDYIIGDGPVAKFGDKVSYNYKGRLAGIKFSKRPGCRRSTFGIILPLILQIFVSVVFYYSVVNVPNILKTLLTL